MENFSIQLFHLGIEAWEAVLRVRDENASVRRSFHGTEDTRSGRRALQSDVQVALEGAGSVIIGLGELKGSVGLSDTLVLVGEAELGKSTAGDEKTGGVGGGPVGETVLDTVAGELVRVGGGQNKVTLELGRDDL